MRAGAGLQIGVACRQGGVDAGGRELMGIKLGLPAPKVVGKPPISLHSVAADNAAVQPEEPITSCSLAIS